MKLNENMKFAFIDTLAATPINFLLNFVCLTIAFSLEMTALEAAPFLTAVFFVCAIIRKYYIREFIDRRNYD